MTAPLYRAELVDLAGEYELVVTDAGTGAVTRHRLGILSVALLAEQSAKALAAHARRPNGHQSSVQFPAVSAPGLQRSAEAKT